MKTLMILTAALVIYLCSLLKNSEGEIIAVKKVNEKTLDSTLNKGRIEWMKNKMK